MFSFVITFCYVVFLYVLTVTKNLFLSQFFKSQFVLITYLLIRQSKLLLLFEKGHQKKVCLVTASPLFICYILLPVIKLFPVWFD